MLKGSWADNCENFLTHMTAVLRSAALVAAALLVAASTAAAAESHTYDAIGRLTHVTYDNGSSIHYTYDPNGNVLSIVTSVDVTGVEDGPQVPLQFALGHATPNPGSGPRAIRFSIPTRGRVALRVFDASGRWVATLADAVYEPGAYVARFSTDRWAPHAYYYRLSLGNRILSGRMVVLK